MRVTASSRSMKILSFFLLLPLTAATMALAEDKATENPAAAQFRKHLEAADANKDGFVTRAELVAEIGKGGRDPEIVEKIVDNMLRDLDADKDGRLSPAEITAGALKVGQTFTTKQNVSRAKQVMAAWDEYRTQHKGVAPASLDELAKQNLVPANILRCIVADGQEKPWGYNTEYKAADGESAVIVYSPGAVDTEGQYLVGLADTRVLGLHGSDLDLEKIPKLKMQVIPDKK